MDKAALILSILAVTGTVANLVVHVISDTQLHRLIRQLKEIKNTDTKVIEKERIIIDNADPGSIARLWYVVREQPAPGSNNKAESWATDSPEKISSIRKNKYRRFFMTTVIAHSADDARTKAEASHKWKELFP